MWNSLVSAVVGSALLVTPASCYAGAKRYADDVAALAEQTAYVQFAPQMELMPGVVLEAEPQVIGSAWAVKTGWREYKLVTAQHVALATMSMPGTLEVCSNEHNCVEVDRLDGVGPVVGGGLDRDWMFWQVDQLPRGLRPSRISTSYAIGDDVCVVGAPLGRAGEVTCGSVTNMMDDYVYVDARVLPGNSGGPVFDDEGRVLGMVIAMDNPVDQGMTPVSDSALVLEAGSLWL